MNPFYLAEHLTADYKEVFEQAVLYGSNQNLSESDFEAALLNLYDLLYTAQKDTRHFGPSTSTPSAWSWYS